MNPTTLLDIMTVFVIVSAIALCIQAGMLAAMYKATKSMHRSIEPLVPKVERLVETSQSTVEQSRKQITEVTTRTNEILDSTKRQLAIIEEVITDGAARAKVQMERAELVMDDTINRVHETVAAVQGGILRPLRELSGVAAGIRAAVQFMGRGNRPNVDRATSDEEMFI